MRRLLRRLDLDGEFVAAVDGAALTSAAGNRFAHHALALVLEDDIEASVDLDHDEAAWDILAWFTAYADGRFVWTDGSFRPGR